MAEEIKNAKGNNNLKELDDEILMNVNGGTMQPIEGESRLFGGVILGQDTPPGKPTPIR